VGNFPSHVSSCQNKNGWRCSKNVLELAYEDLQETETTTACYFMDSDFKKPRCGCGFLKHKGHLDWSCDDQQLVDCRYLSRQVIHFGSYEIEDTVPRFP